MKWSDKFQPIITYDQPILDRFELNAPTKEFLLSTGLPSDAAPFLGFVKNNQTQYEGLLLITEYFDFLDKTFENYLVIGSTGDGDEIVIDLKDGCKIKLLDHEDNFSESFINEDIFKFQRCLIVYQDFIYNLQNEFGENALFDYLYSASHVVLLKNQLEELDPACITRNNFWEVEVKMLFPEE